MIWAIVQAQFLPQPQPHPPVQNQHLACDRGLQINLPPMPMSQPPHQSGLMNSAGYLSRERMNDPARLWLAVFMGPNILAEYINRASKQFIDIGNDLWFFILD